MGRPPIVFHPYLRQTEIYRKGTHAGATVPARRTKAPARRVPGMEVRGMKRLRVAISILALLGACGEESGSRPRNPNPAVGGSPPPDPGGVVAPPPPSWAVLDIIVINFDPQVNALWISWQDDAGSWWSDLLLPSLDVPPGDAGEASQVFVAIPGITYWLVLGDPFGSFLDSVPLGPFAPGAVVPLPFAILGQNLIFL